MDIHRCRFIPYQPQSIDALAFSHSSNSKQSTPNDLRLAIGRQNGCVEIWNPSGGSWLQERIFRGAAQRSIENLQWTQSLIIPEEGEKNTGSGELRLFSSGGSTALTEWDLSHGISKKNVEGNAGDIWCFAAQPQWSQTQIRENMSDVEAAPSQFLAAGCGDGSIVLFSTADDDLQFDKILARSTGKRSPCTSITWRDRNHVVAGFEDSVIRVFDVRSRQVIRSLHLGKSREGDKPLVWAVKCLPNGTILSGDSTGELKIWDASNFSLTQRLKTHSADVMDIAVNSAGTMILTCGVDRRTVAYAPQGGGASSKTQKWHEIRHRRFHEHDVKAIVAFESQSLSIAVSGGTDTVPVVVPLKNWESEYHRSLPHLPQKSQMAIAGGARVLMTWWERQIQFWNILSKVTDIENGQEYEKLLGGIQIDAEEHITAADVSNDASVVVIATSSNVKLFQTRTATTSKDQSMIRSRSLELPKNISNQGATSVGFSPDGKWLYSVRLNNVISLVKLTNNGPKDKPTIQTKIIKLDRKKRKNQHTGSVLGAYNRSISTVAFSSDSRILAVGDLSGNIDTWILEGHEADSSSTSRSVSVSSSASEKAESDSDSDDETSSPAIQGQKWIRTPSGSQLPCLDQPIIALAFRPSCSPPQNSSHVTGNEGLHATRSTHHPTSHEHPSSASGQLVAVTATNQIVIFDTLSCRLAEWSRQNLSSHFPADFKQIKDRVMGVWFDYRTGTDRLWLYGSSFVYMIDLSRKLSQIKRSTSMVKIGKLGHHVLEVNEQHTLVQADKKRKRKSMGAGDEMRDRQKYNTQVLKRGGDRDVDMELTPPASDEEEGQQESQQQIEESDQPQEHIGPATWSTHQYRAIYGICAMNRTDSPPEVVLVERPIYDIALPPRFTDGSEWD